MPSKGERQAGYLTAVGGLLTGALGIALDEPTLIAAGAGALVGGLTVGVGFEPEVGVAAGAVGAVGALAGAKLAGVGAAPPPQPQPTPGVTGMEGTEAGAPSVRKKQSLAIPALIAGGLFLL